MATSWRADIRTLAEANTRATACGWCPQPPHAQPRKECQSITGDWGCGDTDYSKARERWEEARDAWVAEDPEHRNVDDYEPDPPEKPEDEDDFTYGCFGPFLDPGLEPEDEMPALHARKKTTFDGNQRLTGFFKNISQAIPGPVLVTTLTEWSVTAYVYGTSPGIPAISTGKYQYFASPYDCFPTGPTTNYLSWPAFANIPTEKTECEETLFSHCYHEVMDRHDGGDFSTPSCAPGPPGTDQFNRYDFHYERTYNTTKEEISAPFTKSDMKGKAAADVPEDWPAWRIGEGCNASLVVQWPTYDDMCENVEEPDNEDEGDAPQIVRHYPACAAGPAEGEVAASATKVRYRFGIPEDFDRHYEARWDEVFFPKGYAATIDDPAVTPPYPIPPGWTHPQIPDPDAPQPTLLNARSWSRGTGGDEWSAWFNLAVPEEEGETRVVNLRAVSYASKYGTKTTLFGESWAPPEEEAP